MALDATNGKNRWYYQQVPHDVWDLDAVSPPVIIRLKNGKKALAQAGKTAWVYVLDAETGKLICKSDNFNRHENLFAQPTPRGVRMVPSANGGSEWSPTAAAATSSSATRWVMPCSSSRSRCPGAPALPAGAQRPRSEDRCCRRWGG